MARRAPKIPRRPKGEAAVGGSPYWADGIPAQYGAASISRDRGWYFGQRFGRAYLVLHQAGLVPKKATQARIASFLGGATIGLASGGVTKSLWGSLGLNLGLGEIGRRMAVRSGATGWFGIGLGAGVYGSRVLDVWSDWQKLKAAWESVKALPGDIAESTARRSIDVLKEYGDRLGGPTPGESNWSKYGGW